jgi:hypothetical protein
MKNYLDKHIHDILFWVWVPLILPTLTIWKDSIRWLNFMSIFAILYAILAAREARKQ